MSKLRFGMIGAGAISNLHLPAIAAREDCELVCIADVNLEQAQAKAEKYQAQRVVADYNELIAMDDIDAIVVGIPARFHADASIKGLQSGKHVLCEKPMARSMEECDAMIAAAKAADKVLQIGFVRRFDDDWGMMRKLVQEGKAGRPCMWRRIQVGAAPGPPNYGEWYNDQRYSDGPLLESGAHDLDFLRYTYGDVKAVLAHMEHLSHHGDVLDMPVVILYFHSGDTALVQWSWSLARGSAPGFIGMDVVGPEGSIHQGKALESGKWAIEVSRAEGPEVVEYENRRNEDTWGMGQMNDFIRCIQTGGTPRGSMYDGRACQEIYHAAVRSMEEGRRVEL